MKKGFFLIAALAVIGLIAVAATESFAQPTRHNSLEINRGRADDQRGVDSFRINDLSGASAYRIDKTGNLSIIDTSGVTDTFIPRDRVVKVYLPSQFSTWAGAAAGQSYFQCEPGKVYLVDIQSILTNNGAWSGTTALASSNGVSFILPDATKYSGPAYDVEIQQVTLGRDSFDNDTSGATRIIVHPHPGTGATSYQNGSATYKYAQSLNRIYVASGAAYSTNNVAAGASFWMINAVGESAKFRMSGTGQVSAYVLQHSADRVD